MDFINNLPPSLRQSIEQLGEEQVTEQINAFIDKERQKNEQQKEHEVEEFEKYFKPIEPTPLNNPAQTSKNTYGIYGIPVFDPKKSFILKVDVPEGKKPWCKRLWRYIKRLFVKSG